MFKIYESDAVKNITISTYDYDGIADTEITIKMSIKWLPHIKVSCVEEYKGSINYRRYLESEEYKQLVDYTLNKLEYKFNDEFTDIVKFVENTSKIDLTKLTSTSEETDIEKFSTLTEEDIYISLNLENYNGEKILVTTTGTIKDCPNISSILERTFVTDFSYDEFKDSPHRKNIIDDLIKDINNKILNIIKSSIIFMEINNKRSKDQKIN